MKVKPLISNNKNINFSQNNVQSEYIHLQNQPAGDKVSFSGVKNGVSGFFEKMGTNFFLQFMIVDTLSMIIPRVVIGLNRDKEKTGKLNIKAGAEEAGRELLSGPSMGIIPMGILAVVSHFAPASHMHTDTLSALTQNMSGVVNDIKDVKELKSENLNKRLAERMFEDAFGDDKQFKFNNESKSVLKSRFVALLEEAPSLNSKMFRNKEYKAKASEFESLVKEIYNLNTIIQPSDTNTIKLSLTKQVNNKEVKVFNGVASKDFFKDFKNYSKDIVDKFTKANPGNVSLDKGKSYLVEFLNKMQKSRTKIKVSTVIAAFFAVGLFLINLPKLYQRGKISPAQESAKRAQEEAAAFKGGVDENK